MKVYRYTKAGTSVRFDKRGGLTQEYQAKASSDRIQYLGEQQLIEDVQDALSCEKSIDMVVKINTISVTGSVLLREGFRMILREEHNNDLSSFINSFKVLRDIKQMGDDWVDNSLKFVIIGVKDTIVFLCQCAEKLRLIELAQKSELKSFKIL